MISRHGAWSRQAGLVVEQQLTAYISSMSYRQSEIKNGSGMDFSNLKAHFQGQAALLYTTRLYLLTLPKTILPIRGQTSKHMNLWEPFSFKLSQELRKHPSPSFRYLRGKCLHPHKSLSLCTVLPQGLSNAASGWWTIEPLKLNPNKPFFLGRLSQVFCYGRKSELAQKGSMGQHTKCLLHTVGMGRRKGYTQPKLIRLKLPGHVSDRQVEEDHVLWPPLQTPSSGIPFSLKTAPSWPTCNPLGS